MGLSLKKRFALLPADKRRAWVSAQDAQTLAEMARDEWWWTSRPEQTPPPGDWNVCLVLSGRGFGKSRLASEWLIQRCLDFPTDRSGFPTEWLVIAAKRSDALDINMDGASGIRRVLDRREIRYKVKLNPKPVIILTDTDVKIHFQGADSADVGRGFNAAGGILDEIAKWPYPQESWDEGVLLSLRADLPGDHPRVLVTTTPKPIKLLRDWIEEAHDGTVSIVRGSTFDNKDNLAAHSLKKFEKKYQGTRLGRQELYGDLLDDIDGAVFSFSMIEQNRVPSTEGLIIAHTTVGVDPTLTEDGDLMGVVVVARSATNHMYVLADESIGASGRTAADHIWKVFEKWGADSIAIENNQAKMWMHQVLKDSFHELKTKDSFFQDLFDPERVMRKIDSRKGKKIRAEPVGMRYEQKTVHHVGVFADLEEQMLQFDPSDSHNSPDRMDALVHACRHLMEGESRKVRVASPARRRLPRHSATY